ncbi:mersacidin/lichenicidin family type 2 lantibiotic [Hyalangium rubrum]|uniref:Mersacidin/lichenicidin family type 2 lantibiotic n=1 Tax=Hyalangium rubrum TaxID=3103134 RepID=A0ABU5GYG5_9BACT|nr:mersacidin/lichenicidin family type 2 lantibiotic [Hyalangium sp. s54d21]MDY7226234.1 mersacidin/lichenicidin family type 2 lantibiotic [Hyalangium sp. s54d21]
MKRELIIRAWKDPEFRARLSTEERDALPESPAGYALSELDESHLADVVGGRIGPDQDLGDFPPWVTPYIRVNPFGWQERATAFKFAAQRF